MLRRLAGCPDLMIAQPFHKREFLIRELEILVPNRSFRRPHRGARGTDAFCATAKPCSVGTMTSAMPLATNTGMHSNGRTFCGSPTVGIADVPWLAATGVELEVTPQLIVGSPQGVEYLGPGSPWSSPSSGAKLTLDACPVTAEIASLRSQLHLKGGYCEEQGEEAISI